MKIHFIAIGGAAMHNLALALQSKGYIITGSDDEIFEPSRSRLLKKGLLPTKTGWYPEKIHEELDAVILGMHAKADNPELIRAKELKIPLYSFPEFLFEQSKDKLRVVIGGSHGKTTITAMILHVLRQSKVDYDYMVGAMLDGFDVMVKITEKATVMIFEGDEYLTSALDPRPKFHLYQPDIALISGIAWDHFNVFPTFENYVYQFEAFIRLIRDNGSLIYFNDDQVLRQLAHTASSTIIKIPYTIPEYRINNGITEITIEGIKKNIHVFGEHNLANLSGAWQICRLLGVNADSFLQAISSYKGASNRLEMVFSDDKLIVFRDFAHSPSKLKASIEAVKQQFPSHKLIACMELHTYSSLNADFLQQYKSCMDSCDFGIVYYNPHTLDLKRLPQLSKNQVNEAFCKPDLHISNSSDDVFSAVIRNCKAEKTAILIMSSGDFNGMNINLLTENIQKIQKNN